MSQSQQKNFHSRRSESCLHKHSAFQPATSEEEKEEDTAAHTSQPCPPLLTATQSVYLPREKLASACCVCYEQCSASRSSKSSAVVKNKKSSIQAQQLRETLQVYLIRTRVEEAMMDDKRTSLMQHLNLVSNAFEALTQHIQSLEVSYLAAERVFNVSRALLAYREPSSADDSINEDFVLYHRQVEIEKNKRNTRLRELIEHCSKNIILPEDVSTLLGAHRDRRKDFSLAFANFKNLLDNSKLSVSQMEKLHRQYNSILKDFQQNRQFLDTELPKIINLRLETLQQVFHKVTELYNNVDCNVQVMNLFKLIAINLNQITDTGKKLFHEQEINDELGQKI